MSIKPRLHTIAYRWRHHLKWGLIHTALVIFFADALAVFWPEFEHVWTGIAHTGVAIAAFLATVAEYIHDDEEKKDE